MKTTFNRSGYLSLLVLATVLGCGPVVEDAGLPSDTGGMESALTVSQQRARCDSVKSVAAPRGITNPLIYAGIAYHESGLAQCYSEASVHCAGPYSSDCGGAVLAGSGDGACSLQEGGLGMFQLDSGTYSQTLSAYGNAILTVNGNISKGIDVIINKVRVCPNTRDLFTTDEQAIDWLNSAKPGTDNYETFLTTMAWCYNGCSPTATSCNHNAMRSAYDNGVRYLLNTFGDAYWYDSLPVAGVGTNGDGRLEVFMRGQDGAIYHSWQMAPNGGWSGWYSLGGNLAGNPVVGRNADGRLSVFARGPSRDLWVISQSSGGWSGWGGLGGTTDYDPAVASNQDGRLIMAVRATDAAVYALTQGSPNGAFGSWQVLGGSITGRPTLENRQDGGLELFGRYGSGEPFHAWQLAPNSGSWSGWYGLTGNIRGDTVAKRHADGRVFMFARGTDDALYYVNQTAPNSGWSGWTLLGGTISSEPAVGINADGSMTVFARGGGGAVYYRRLTAAGWSAWGSLGGVTTSSPAVGRYQDGRLAVFVRGDTGIMYVNVQSAPSSDSWSGWQFVGDGVARF